jgi:hypothetical protein
MNIICQSLYYQYILDKFHFFKSPKFSNFRLLHWLDFSEMYSGLLKIHCYVYPWDALQKLPVTWLLRVSLGFIMVRDRRPDGHAPTYQISLTYLERQKSYGPDKLRWEEAEAEEAKAEEKIRLKQYVSLRSKGRHN